MAISTQAAEYTQIIIDYASEYYLSDGSDHTIILSHRNPGQVAYKVYMSTGQLSWYEGGRWWSPTFGKRNLRKILAAIHAANNVNFEVR